MVILPLLFSFPGPILFDLHPSACRDYFFLFLIFLQYIFLFTLSGGFVLSAVYHLSPSCLGGISHLLTPMAGSILVVILSLHSLDWVELFDAGDLFLWA